MGTDNIELADITLIAHQLNKLSEFNEENTPDQLVSSPAFKKFWPDWSKACVELMEWDEEIKQMKSDMAS